MYKYRDEESTFLKCDNGRIRPIGITILPGPGAGHSMMTGFFRNDDGVSRAMNFIGGWPFGELIAAGVLERIGHCGSRIRPF
jgi:hypothetical protein